MDHRIHGGVHVHAGEVASSPPVTIAGTRTPTMKESIFDCFTLPLSLSPSPPPQIYPWKLPAVFPLGKAELAPSKGTVLVFLVKSIGRRWKKELKSISGPSFPVIPLLLQYLPRELKDLLNQINYSVICSIHSNIRDAARLGK